MDFGVSLPFVELLGFDLVLFDDGHSQINYEPKPEHMNSFNVAHGGTLMTLMDVTMAAAARSRQKDMGVVTIEMKTSFMQPCRGMLHAKGRLIHRTQALAFTEATIFDAAGNACAYASGTFKYVRHGTRPADAGTSPLTPNPGSTDPHLISTD